MANRAQRRHGMSGTNMTQAMLKEKYMEGVKAGFDEGVRNCIKSCYASMILALIEEFGFDHDQCYKAIVAADSHVLYCIEHQEIAQEIFEKVGLLLNFDDPFERIERTSD